MDGSTDSVPPLSREEAAAYLGVSKARLVQLASTGGGPKFNKEGRRVIYTTADLDAWKANRGDPTGAASPPLDLAQAVREFIPLVERMIDVPDGTGFWEGVRFARELEKLKHMVRQRSVARRGNGGA